MTLSDYETHTCEYLNFYNVIWSNVVLGENFYIRSSGGLDLSRLSKTHKVYMSVVSGKMDAMEGSLKLREIVKSVSEIGTSRLCSFKLSLINTTPGRWFLSVPALVQPSLQWRSAQGERMRFGVY